jgi:multidrug resistance efflux pump
MSDAHHPRLRAWSYVALLLTPCACFASACGTQRSNGRAPAGAGVEQTVPDGSGAAIRLSGAVEAVRSRTVAVPRLSGTYTPLVITYLVKPGTRVEPGDPLVEFDPQEQERLAFDKQAEVVDLNGQIEKKKADQAAAEAKDQTELVAAEHDVERARLTTLSNELIARIEAEKNTLALEQATARFDQLKTTFALKRQAAVADLRILDIRRARSQQALEYARKNTELMQIRAPFAGLAVIKTMYRNGTFAEILEGDEVRPGFPVVDIVDTSEMRVRARINQADALLVKAGQAVTVGLDGFPELRFPGRIELITPLATVSGLSAPVRSFTAVVSIQGADPQLLPDLTAWVDIPFARTAATAPGTPEGR